MGLVGENGAGKTTLLSIILNRRLPTSGAVLIEGAPVQAALGRMGFVMDCHDYHGNFSLQEIDSYIDAIYRDWNRAAFHDLIERLHIETSKKSLHVTPPLSFRAPPRNLWTRSVQRQVRGPFDLRSTAGAVEDSSTGSE
jgi:ABC-2 type transport system ATP-binding protein